VPFAFVCFLLLGAIIVNVVYLLPDQPPDYRQLIVMHQSAGNIVMAEKMITPLLDSPPTRWLGPEQCIEIGRGVWYADGVVQTEAEPPFGRGSATAWKAIFIPATSQALFLALQSGKSEGDAVAALQKAGIQPRHP